VATAGFHFTLWVLSPAANDGNDLLIQEGLPIFDGLDVLNVLAIGLKPWSPAFDLDVGEDILQFLHLFGGQDEGWQLTVGGRDFQSCVSQPFWSRISHAL